MNIKNKLVTVCIPAYNHAQYIEETINSIINQTYQNIELLIINDGSPDQTDEKIKSLIEVCRKRFIRFEYINRKNKGLMNTLKEFETLMNGYYICVVASDDYFDITKVEKQVDILEKYSDYAMCYTRSISVDNNSNIIGESNVKYNKSGFIFKQLLMRNFIPALTVMLRKDIFDSVGGYDLAFKYEDYPLWLNIAYKYKIYYLDEKLAYYRRHETNMSHNLILIDDEHEKLLHKWSKEKGYQQAINYFYFKRIRQYIEIKDLKLTEYYIKKLSYINFLNVRLVILYLKYLKLKYIKIFFKVL